MAKNIKKYVKYLAFTAGFIIVLLVILGSLINIPAFQTMLVNRYAKYLSEEFKTSISVGRVEFRFFNRVKLEDLLIKDMNNDTLLFVGTTNVNIKNIDQEKNSFSFSKISLDDPYVAILTDTTGITNINWYLDIIKGKKDTLKAKKQTYISINQADINKGRFKKIDFREDTSKRDFVNYNNIDVFDINGVFNKISIGDTLKTVSLSKLSLQEKSGFTLDDAHIDMDMKNDRINITSILFDTPKSSVNIPIIAAENSNGNLFDNFIDNASLKITIGKSNISLSDMSFFLSQIPNISNALSISGKFHGTVAELRGRDLNVNFGQHTVLNVDLDISGLPHIKDSYVYLNIDKLTANASDIEKITNNLPKEITLPEILYNLGTISLDGTYTGFSTDFVAYGNVKSKYGNINTDISLIPDSTNKLSINGLVRADTLNIGYLTNNKKIFGLVSMNANIDGQIDTHLGNFSGILNGMIDSIDIYNYRYRDVKIDGKYSKNTWDGHINIDEENIYADLSGFLNFNKKMPEFNFMLDIDRANLFPLNLSGTDSTSQLKLSITSNCAGNNIFNLDGQVDISDVAYVRNGKTLSFDTFTLQSTQSDNLQTISLRTDYIDGDLYGQYDENIISTINNTLISLFPAVFNGKPVDVKPSTNNFDLKIHFKETDELNDFLNTGILLSNDSYITGALRQDSILELRGKANSLDIKKVIVNDFSFSSYIKDSKVDMDINGEKIIFPWKSEIDNFVIDMDTHTDTFDIDIHWDNKTAIKNNGQILATGTISKTEGSKKPKIEVDIASSEIYNNNEQWLISQSAFRLDTTSISISNFDLRNDEKFYHLNGTISEDPHDTINMSINSINLKSVNSLLGNNKPKKQKKHPLVFDIGGTLDGNMYVTNLYHTPLVECAIEINDFSILGSDFGDMSINSQWNYADKKLDINGLSRIGGQTILDIDGYYYPNNSSIYLDLVPTHIPLEAINQFVQSFASNIKGTASGKLNLSGPLNKLVLKGAVRAEDMNMKINILQTEYLVNDSIYFDKNAILFKETQFADERGNRGYVTGSATHDYFKDIRADVLINVDQIQAINTKAKDNKNFYGTVYATGIVTIKTDGPNTSVDVSARTNKNSKIYIPLNSSGKSISEYSYISFINKDTLNTNLSEQTAQPPRKSSTSLSVDLTATPDAEIQLIFDSTVGDILKLHGSGDLNLELTPKNEVKVNGEYFIEDGDYLFTLGNLINKSFSVDEGGKITFNGDIQNTVIDLSAVYKVRASLYEILQDEKFSERIPVECQLLLSGELVNPLVKFGINLPNADDETKSYLNSIISTDEELSRQFIYLLVMNSFYASTGNNPTTTGSSALSVTTTEMLFNQVGNWLSQITNDLDVGLIYTPGTKDINSQEFQVALSTQLLDNRITINSDFGYRGAAATNSGNEQITGDFDIEYKITEKIRFKAFNRYNNPYTGRQADYTQGVGLVYKQEFNKISDLFKRKKKSSDAKREEDIHITDKE